MKWYENAVMYHIYPLGFCGAPKHNEGGEPVNRLEKVLDWIPHLKELGVDAVYFGPVFESVEHGYAIDDELAEKMLAQGTFLSPTVMAVHVLAVYDGDDPVGVELREKIADIAADNERAVKLWRRKGV